MATDDVPAGPDGELRDGLDNSQDSFRPMREDEPGHDDCGMHAGVPNLCDLLGMLRVTVVAVRNTPLVPAPDCDEHTAADQGLPPARRKQEGAVAGVPQPKGTKGVRGSPFLKLQMGLHQFQTMEPTLAPPKDDELDASPDEAAKLEWGQTLWFQLSGDMRELRISLFNWESKAPMGDGPQGVVRIPVSELVHRQWANVPRLLSKMMLSGWSQKPLRGGAGLHTSIEISVVYTPADPASSVPDEIDGPGFLRIGCMITCEMCRRRVFVPARPTLCLVAKKEKRVKSQRKILLWLRDYDYSAAMDMKRLEVPCSLFALPACIFGPESRLSKPLRAFLAEVIQDTTMTSRLKESRLLNHHPRLNTWSPLYCSADYGSDGLADAASVDVWGMQDMASKLEREIQEDFRENYDRYLHLWVKSHYIRFPANDEGDAERAWVQIKEEIEAVAETKISVETTLVRLMVLANVLNRPIVVHSDEPVPESCLSPRTENPLSFEDQQGTSEARFALDVVGGAVEREGRKIKISDSQQIASGPLVRGIYLPLLHSKPLLLESNRRDYRPPVPLVYCSERRVFLPLAPLEAEESHLFEILPWPPLLPLFVGHRLLPLPFCDTIDTNTLEGSAKGEKFVRKFVMCEDLSVARKLVLLDCPEEGGGKDLSRSEKSRCVALAATDTPKSPMIFHALLKRYLTWADHYHNSAELHEAQELADFEHMDLVAQERPWLRLTSQNDVDDVRQTFANGKYSQNRNKIDSADQASASEEQRMSSFYHACLRLASCIKTQDIDSALHLLDEGLRQYVHQD